MPDNVTPFVPRPYAPDAAERRTRGDLRSAHRAICTCGHEWWAPVIGKCPRCGGAGVQIAHSQELDYVRV